MIPTEKKIYELKIDPEFQSLLPPLAPEELDSLRKQICEEGCREALTTWNGVIVDGHNRYGICQENHVPFTYTEREFESRDMAKAWMIQTQIGRRNLIAFQKVELAATRESLIREMAKESQVRKPANYVFVNSRKHNTIHTDDEIANLAGVSNQTVYRARVIKNDGTPEQLDRARIGGKGNSINAIYNEIKEKDVEEKQCRRCGETKPKDQFLTGTTLCKECRKETDREREEQEDASPEPIQAPEPEQEATEAMVTTGSIMSAREMSKLFDKITSESASKADRTYTPDDLKEELDAMVSDFSKKLNTALTIHSAVLAEEDGIKKATAALLEAETAIKKIKEMLTYG